MKFKVPFYKHDLGQAELDSVRKVLDQPILTTGSFVREFEEVFAAYMGVQHVIGVTSCTAALQLSLHALGVKPGDEVITTPMTFIATATSILQAGATPVFVDVEPDTGNIDIELVSKKVSSKTKAVIPVHLFGQMVDMSSLNSLCSHHGISIVEDAAHCVGGMRDGISPGNSPSSAAACFSFYATKHLTCGEGGAIITNNPDMDTQLRLLRNHGMTRDADQRSREGYKDWDMTRMGWKYNMSNLDAALLIPQVCRLDDNRTRLNQISDKYSAAFAGMDTLTIPRVLGEVVHARHLFPIILLEKNRTEFVEEMAANGIGVVVNYLPVHLMTYFRQEYRYNIGDFPHAEYIGQRIVSLPLYPSMSDEDVDLVIGTVQSVLK